MLGNAWTYEDYNYMYQNYNKLGVDVVSQELNRSVVTVNAKAIKLGLKSAGPFTEEEKKLARSYGKNLGTALMFLLPHRTSVEIEELLECQKED